MPGRVVAFAAGEAEPSYDRPRPDRLVAGNPLRATCEHFTAITGDMSAGTWSCEPGAWNIAFATGKDEFFCVIEGRIRIVDDAGIPTLFGPGEAGVIPAGFTGRFEVLEAVRKYYVVIERPEVSGAP